MAVHAVVITVTVNDREQAVAALRDQVVPQVSSMPGFVAGYWTDLGGNRGASMVVWESEEAARQAADQAEAPGSFVTFDSVEVAEVVASA
jgi:heme-degrading monooxygenase HmoA